MIAICTLFGDDVAAGRDRHIAFGSRFVAEVMEFHARRASSRRSAHLPTRQSLVGSVSAV